MLTDGVLPGFDPPPPAKDAPKAERLPQHERDRLAIEAGIHPATRLRLAENGKTCGDCRWLRRKSAGGWTGWKCGTPDPNSKNHRGDGRDMTKRWPACAAFAEKTGDPR
ncbi:hypothetical protein MicroSTF_14395 [Microbacterium sp. STF-2]|uniref:hypothetical protein n=1 Tax=Microbacterium sp. STF-2 TaxID=3031132 RepID=UPI002AFF6E1E|nr:hypothetical protein [Microbacterium sp. STF-2]MEA1264230.1 hypothetical protein [Microbacterium sp. STF-2]